MLEPLWNMLRTQVYRMVPISRSINSLNKSHFSCNNSFYAMTQTQSCFLF